jgi:hypothetical protein
LDDIDDLVFLLDDLCGAEGKFVEVLLLYGVKDDVLELFIERPKRYKFIANRNEIRNYMLEIL